MVQSGLTHFPEKLVLDRAVGIYTLVFNTGNGVYTSVNTTYTLWQIKLHLCNHNILVAD